LIAFVLLAFKENLNTWGGEDDFRMKQWNFSSFGSLRKFEYMEGKMIFE
jgi:hypothetical protein